MNALLAITLQSLGITEQDHQLGFKDVTVAMMDESKQTVRIRRYATPQDSAAAWSDYQKSGDPRHMLSEMLCGPGTPEFFESIDFGELVRLRNIAMVLLFSLEHLETMLAAELQNLDPNNHLEAVATAFIKIVQDQLSHEGGFSA